MSEVKERKIEAGLSQDVINKYSELEIQRGIKVVENDVSIFCMDFGDAVRALKDGKRVARKGWNGKGMFLYFVPAGNYSDTSAPDCSDSKTVFGLPPNPGFEKLHLRCKYEQYLQTRVIVGYPAADSFLQT